jgi:hypothetical protein
LDPQKIGALLSELFIKQINTYFKTAWLQESFSEIDQSLLFREWLFFNSFIMFQGVSAYFRGSSDGHLVLDAFHETSGDKFVRSKVFSSYPDYLEQVIGRYKTYSNCLKDQRPPNPLHWMAKQFCQYCSKEKDIIPIMPIIAASEWFTRCSIKTKELVRELVEKS